jgi:ABC-type uncharacterized transport system permease subunit
MSMNNSTRYIGDRISLGWILTIAGALLFVAGLALQAFFELSFNARIVSGAGILLSALGLAQIIRYNAVRKNGQAAARLVNEALDERNRIIRERAAARGFWVSIGLTYIALLWLSFAASGSLPAPSPEAQWYYLAASVVVPFAIYIGSGVYDQSHN